MADEYGELGEQFAVPYARRNQQAALLNQAEREMFAALAPV
jgi:hypothetical protein